MDKKEFPISPEIILAAISTYLSEDGLAVAANALSSSWAEIIQTEFDNWNGGTYRYCFQIYLLATDFILIGSVGIESLQKAIGDKLNVFSTAYPNQLISEVSIIPTQIARSEEMRHEYTDAESSIKLSNLSVVIKQIESFRLCSPSADPEEITAVVYGFKALAKRFIASVSRVQDPNLHDLVSRLNVNIEDNIYEVYDLFADIAVVIEYLNDIGSGNSTSGISIQQFFVDLTVIEQIRQLRSQRFDVSKLTRICEEINSCYANENYISTALLIRALMNHIPECVK